MKRKHKIGGSFSSLLSDLFEEPSGELPGGWSVRLTDGREAYVTGCRAILSYDDSEIRIDAGEVCVRIIGCGLDIARYNDLEITVRGHVTSVTAEDV